MRAEDGGGGGGGGVGSDDVYTQTQANRSLSEYLMGNAMLDNTSIALSKSPDIAMTPTRRAHLVDSKYYNRAFDNSHADEDGWSSVIYDTHNQLRFDRPQYDAPTNATRQPQATVDDEDDYFS